MTRAELRDWRVRAMGGEMVPADVVLELIDDAYMALKGDHARTDMLGRGHCLGCEADYCNGRSQ